MHPFAEALYVNNKELFDTIYNHLITDDVGKKVRKDHITSKDKGGLGMDESDPLTKVEILVESIAIAARQKKPRKTGGIVQAMRRFFRWLKSMFFPKAMHRNEYQITQQTTFRDIADMLTNYETEEFISVDYNKDVQAVFERIEGLARFQPLEPSKATKREANHLFEGAWKDVQKIFKKDNLRADPFDFSASMINSIPSGVLRDYFNDWFYSKFEDHPDLKIRRKSKGKNIGFIAEPDDVQAHVIELFNDTGIREGLDRLSEEGSQDEREIGINEQIWQEELNIYLREGQLANLKRKARKTASFESFAKEILPEYLLRRVYHARTGDLLLTKDQLAKTKRFYYRINSYIRTNQEEGKGNERDNYVIKKHVISDDNFRFEIVLKDGVNFKTGNQNTYAEKITLHENNVKKGVISWLSGKDYYILEQKTDEEGRPYEDVESPYGFLNAEELNAIEVEANKMNLTVVFSRGESDRIGFTRITDTHKDLAKNMEAYVDKEVTNKYVPNRGANIKAFKTAADIAAHEAMKTVWPKYLYDEKGSANNMKRIKIPFTPVTISKDMPEFNFKIFDYNKASFVDTQTGKETSAVYTKTRGAGRKYIMDGGTLGSRDLFNRLVQYGGAVEGSGSSKNVIYHVEGMNTLMVKHELNLTPRNIEVWYNKGQAGEQLVAKVDNKGNITDAEGNAIDLLMTPDEAKVYDGYDIDAVHTIPGQSIGFIGYRDKTSKTSTHGLQWYSYIDSPEIIQAFKNNILPKVHTQLSEIWNYSVDNLDKNGNPIPGKMSADKIRKLLVDVLEHNDNEGYRHTMTEHAKLGAGLFQGLEPMLNQIIQNKRMNKTIRVGYQPGSRLKITGNLRGDLNENEVAIGKEDARVVYEAYSVAHDDMSIEDVKKEGVDKINKWLKKNEVNITVVRYPVPHEGGLVLAKVKRLHNRRGVIEMHPVDVFAKLEGDMDGDEVQIEKLSPSHESLVKDYVGKLNVNGINLSKYVPKKRDKIIFTNKENRFELMDALFYGEMAIGEIANLMNVLGQLSLVFDHAVIDNKKIVLRSLNEVSESKMFKGMKIKDVLRTYLQASLDNVEFMLLKDWDYDIRNLYGALFKRADGKSLNAFQSARIYNALKPLIDIHKKAGHIRKGLDFKNGKYGLSDTVRESNDFLIYQNHRHNYVMNKSFETYDPFNIYHGILNDIVFKEGTSGVAVTSQIVVKSIPDIKVIEGKGDGISLMRKPNTDRHYGNPFSHKEGSIAAVKTKNREESIERFDAWLRGKADQNIEPQRRAWILSQIKQGKLDNAKLLYFEDTKDNHAKRLLKYIKEQENVLTSPWEDIATAPARTMQEHITKYDRKGLEETVFRLSDLTHQNAHLDSVDFLWENRFEIIETAYQQDVRNGIAVGDKLTYLKSQEKIAGSYKTLMGNAWFKALMKVDKVGAQTIDRNANVVEMTNEYDKEFKNLSKSAKVIATIGFLKGFINTTNNMAKRKYDKFGMVRVIRALPPASRSKNELQLLDSSVLFKFYKKYNEIVSNPSDRVLSKKSKKRTHSSMEETIRRICGVN